MRLVVVFLALASLVLGSDALGTWNCAALSPEGEPVKFVLKVQQQGGGVAAFVEDARGTMPVINPKLEGSTLTFQVDYDGARFTLELKASGDQIKGTYRGEPATGEVKGTRKS